MQRSNIIATALLQQLYQYVFPLRGFSATARRAYAAALAANPGLDRKHEGALPAFLPLPVEPLKGGGHALKAVHGGTFYDVSLESKMVALRGYRTYFHGLSLVDCTIQGDLEKCHLRGCSILHSRFAFSSDKLHVSHCDFSGSALTGNQMRFGEEGGRIFNSCFDRTTVSLWFFADSYPTTLERCSFVGADLRQAIFNGAVLLRCDLRGADLRGARVATILLCDLRGAKVEGMQLHGMAAPWTLVRLWLGGADLSHFSLAKGLHQWMSLTNRPMEDLIEEGLI
jgi:uncharacterized protein YjbI with pentapeptide repeats